MSNRLFLLVFFAILSFGVWLTYEGSVKHYKNRYSYNSGDNLFPKISPKHCPLIKDCAILAEAGYYEARSESDEGVKLVMKTITNRVQHRRWENSIEGVVYEHRQFSYTHDGSKRRAEQSKKQWDRMYSIALDFYLGVEDTPEEWESVTHYLAKGVKTGWAKGFRVVDTVGNHVAYSCTKNC